MFSKRLLSSRKQQVYLPTDIQRSPSRVLYEVHRLLYTLGANMLLPKAASFSFILVAVQQQKEDRTKYLFISGEWHVLVNPLTIFFSLSALVDLHKSMKLVVIHYGCCCCPDRTFSNQPLVIFYTSQSILTNSYRSSEAAACLM